jgi:hypothetical protein
MNEGFYEENEGPRKRERGDVEMEEGMEQLDRRN